MNRDLISDLFDTLNVNGILYSHWKGNFSLTQALSGEKDIELFVERTFLSKVIEIILRFGFKPVLQRWGAEKPGIYHYYCFDPDRHHLLHIHLLNSVITGESFVPSHILPLDSLLLDNTYTIGQVKLTSKPAELILFVLRTYIKYGALLDLVFMLGKSEDLKTELQWLLSDGDTSESLALLNKYCPLIDKKLFIACIDGLKQNGFSIKKLLLAHRVRTDLQIYAKYNILSRVMANFQFLWQQIWRLLFGNKKNRVPGAGGIVIAFVGPEATGKSTLVSESEQWLRKIFTVKSIHAGKPSSTWVTYPVNIFLPLLRKLIPGFRTNHLEGHVPAKKSSPQFSSNSRRITSLLYAIRSVTLAWDRRHLLNRARRSAAKGEIIICDRYPSLTVGAMDSPRLLENPNSRGFRLFIYNYLAHLETKIYRKIPAPDLVLQLSVSIEIAKQRNKDRIKKDKESDEYLESRHQQKKGWKIHSETRIHSIDTDQSLDKTILLVKKTIWEAL